METISFNDCFYTDLVENLAGFFCECFKLESLDLSHFEFDSATITKGRFQECGITNIGCTITLPDGCDTQDMYKGSKLG